MTRLHRLHAELGQSPWLDNLERRSLTDGTLARSITDGVRGVTANPTTFAKAVEGSADYDQQFAALCRAGMPVRDAYWELVLSDTIDALHALRPLHDRSGGEDGFVSLEVDPALADDTDGTILAARWLHERLGEPNAFVKIPATDAGLPAIETMTAEGRSINITLIFSLSRYQQVIDAYQYGLDAFVRNGGDPSTVRSVASFFLSRVDTEVDRRLDDDHRHLAGRAAIAQARAAYAMFLDSLRGERWTRLAAVGARPQRPLWASTSAKNPAYPDTMYVDSLIGPDTITTMPEATIVAFEDHGRLERTLDADPGDATRTLADLLDAGIDVDDVGRTLERQGIESFHASFDRALAGLAAKSAQLVER